MTAPDIHALTGPYVLDAVADDERASFEQHLAGCTVCSTEVSDLREAAVKLSIDVALPPPMGLKPKVMTAVSQKRQLFPAPRTELHPGGRRRPAQGRIGRRSFVLAAAFLAVAGTGAVALDQYRANAATTAISNSAAAILAQPDTRTVHGPVAGGGQATVVLSGHTDAAVVLVRDLKPLTGRKTYQMWLINGSHQARSIGLTNGKSIRPTVVTAGVTGSVAFGITIEPQRGSTYPTLPTTGGLQPVVRLDTPTT